MEIEAVLGTLLKTNNYVVGNSSDVIIFEASANLEKIKKIVNGRNVVGIFLTHGHWDHCQNIDEFVNYFNCKVFAHKNILPKLTCTTKFFNFDKPIKSKLTENNFVFVADNEKLNFNSFSVECIYTPGHTNCSMCYLIDENNEKILISGDTLFKDGVGRCDLPTSSPNSLISSLKKLLNLQESLKVFPGHGEQTILKDEKNFINSLT